MGANMETTTLSTICRRTGLTKARVARWISDGHFTVISSKTEGCTRRWSREDTIRLLAMARLVEAGSPVEIGRAIGPLGPHVTQTYLVVATVLVGGSISHHAHKVDKQHIGQFLSVTPSCLALHVIDLTDIEQTWNKSIEPQIKI